MTHKVQCMACGKGTVTLRSRFIWPWQRLRGLKIRLRGVCPMCRTEATINGWK